MNTQQNIFLVGPMGAGKTTIGRYLASELKRDFYDSDHVVEERTGVEIAWIFDLEGEAGFREREKEAIAELTQLSSIVLATGGGSVTTPENRRVLAGRGFVVYLQASLEQQLARTEKDKKRPLLQTDDRQQRIQELHEQRDPLYREIADCILETHNYGVKSICKQIISTMRKNEH